MVEVSSGNRKNITGYFSKMVAIVAFACIISALIIILKSSPATGYELSIYSALPLSVWILLIASIFCGMSIIVHQALSNNEGNFWLIGFAILILTSFIILSLPVFRGYYLYGTGDTLAHLKYTSSIVSQGFFEENYYPVTHILGASLVQVLSLPPEIVMMYLPVIFTVLFIIFIYLLSTTVSVKRGHAMLAAAAGTIPLFIYYHISAYPHALALLTFPLFFYLYFKSSNTLSLPWRIAMLIVLFLFPFFHPVPQIILISCLIGGVAAKWLWAKRDIPTPMAQGISLDPALISVVTFFLWISYFAVLGSGVQRIFNWITGEMPVVARTGELQTIIGRGLWEILELTFKMYGQNLILIILSLLAVWVITRRFLQHRSEFRNLFSLSFILMICGLAYFIMSIGLGLVTWGRLLGANIGLWAAPVLAGFILYELFRNDKVPKTIGVMAVLVILTLSSAIGIFSIYRSPWILQPNWQITYADISGANWVSEYRELEIPVTEMGWVQAYPQVEIPDHFGYPEHETLGESIDKDTYLIIAERFKQASDDPILSERGMMSPPIIASPGFNEDDFARIEIDQSVNKLYSNGEFEIFFAKSLGENEG